MLPLSSAASFTLQRRYHEDCRGSAIRCASRSYAYRKQWHAGCLPPDKALFYSVGSVSFLRFRRRFRHDDAATPIDVELLSPLRHYAAAIFR